MKRHRSCASGSIRGKRHAYGNWARCSMSGASDVIERNPAVFRPLYLHRRLSSRQHQQRPDATGLLASIPQRPGGSVYRR